MHKTIRWGILGCGHIAGKFASDLALVPDAKLVASYGRDLNHAEAFAARHGGRAYADREAFLASPDIDVVYIGTPHSCHVPDTLDCLEFGKPVLCEKPFALSLDDADAVIAKAASKRLFLMEALWTRFLPDFVEADRLVRDGALGTPHLLCADFGLAVRFNPTSRLFDPALGGGTLWDIGIYPLFLARHFLGNPDSLEMTATLGSTGVDERLSLSLAWKNGSLAHLLTSFREATPCRALLYGSSGTLAFEPMFHTPTDLVRTDAAGVVRRIDFAREGFGYQHEALHVNECLRQGWTESPLWSLADTRELLVLLRRIADRLPAAGGK